MGLARVLVSPIVAVAAAVAVPSASATVYSERAGDIDRSVACVAWETAISGSLALYGITGTRAASYIALRADNPCHGRITPRSLLHAGDPA